MRRTLLVLGFVLLSLYLLNLLMGYAAARRLTAWVEQQNASTTRPFRIYYDDVDVDPVRLRLEARDLRVESRVQEAAVEARHVEGHVPARDLLRLLRGFVLQRALEEPLHPHVLLQETRFTGRAAGPVATAKTVQLDGVGGLAQLRRLFEGQTPTARVTLQARVQGGVLDSALVEQLVDFDATAHDSMRHVERVDAAFEVIPDSGYVAVPRLAAHGPLFDVELAAGRAAYTGGPELAALRFPWVEGAVQLRAYPRGVQFQMGDSLRFRVQAFAFQADAPVRFTLDGGPLVPRGAAWLRARRLALHLPPRILRRFLDVLDPLHVQTNPLRVSEIEVAYTHPDTTLRIEEGRLDAPFIEATFSGNVDVNPADLGASMLRPVRLRLHDFLEPPGRVLDIFTPYLGFEPAWQDGGVVLVLRGPLAAPTVTEPGGARSEVVAPANGSRGRRTRG